MNREEILDMAMDILDNTDATLEEAMGIAMETLKSGEKNNVKGLNYAESRGTLKDREMKAYRGKGRAVLIGHSDPQSRTLGGVEKGSRSSMTISRDKNTVTAHMHSHDLGSSMHAPMPRGGHDLRAKASLKDGPSVDLSIMNRRSGRIYGSAHTTPAGDRTFTGVLHEAAIMDTALDFLDMYDVSLEEAIDMAYDYLID